MNAEQYRKLADQLAGEYGQATLWVREEAAALLRSLADALEKGPAPCGRMLTPAAKGGFPVYDSTAILAAEMRGEERMRERCAQEAEAHAKEWRGSAPGSASGMYDYKAEAATDVAEGIRALGAGEKG